MAGEVDFMTRDFPGDTDFEDEAAVYGTHFGNLWFSDDEYEWPRLLELYRDADEVGRRTINNVFLCLVGYIPCLVSGNRRTQIRQCDARHRLTSVVLSSLTASAARFASA